MEIKPIKDLSLIGPEFIFHDNIDKMDKVIGCFEEDSKLVGYLSYIVDRNGKGPSSIDLLFIEVLPEFRNRGIAKALLIDLMIYVYRKGDIISLYPIDDDSRIFFNKMIREGILPRNTKIGG